MLRAAVPEASIYEHDNSGSDERDVGAPSQSRQRPIDSEAEANAVKRRTKGELLGRIASWRRLHPASYGR